MKCIDAILRPNSLDAVKDSSVSIGVDVTVAKVRDFGHQKRHSEVYRGTD
jgi:nitrogen regulatory protein P-II 1